MRARWQIEEARRQRAERRGAEAGAPGGDAGDQLGEPQHAAAPACRIRPGAGPLRVASQQPGYAAPYEWDIANNATSRWSGGPAYDYSRAVDFNHSWPGMHQVAPYGLHGNVMTESHLGFPGLTSYSYCNASQYSRRRA